MTSAIDQYQALPNIQQVNNYDRTENFGGAKKRNDSAKEQRDILTE